MSRVLHVLLDVERLTASRDTGEPPGAIDPELADLLAFSREQSIATTILCTDTGKSVRRMLHDAGWDEVRVVTESTSWLPDESRASLREHATFPFANTECDRCAQCRRNLMLGTAGEGDVLIYAGDGHSDPCPAEYADIVFARGRLQTWCQQQNITYYHFGSFGEIRRRLAIDCAHRRLRPRARAERKRREAYMVEA